MTTFAAEFYPVHTPLPAKGRCFILFDAPDVKAAIDAAQANGMFRHDKTIQVDIYERNGDTYGRKIWSGLHRVAAVRPELKIVRA